MFKTHAIRAAAVIGLVLAFLSAVPLAHAQAVAPVRDAPPSKTRALPTDEEVITLSAFTVSEKKTNDYVASETVTGTRLATLIRDLPFQVDVVTSEFMSDFATFTMAEELGYVSNFSPTASNSGPILRGFKTVPFVDGFRRITGSMPPEVDTKSASVIKGPAASIYGQTVPGGVVNRELKHPGDKQQSGFKVSLGSNKTTRANAFSTGPLGTGKKLFYRVSIEDDSRKYDQDYSSQRMLYTSAQILWKPSRTLLWNTRISYSEEHNNDRTALATMKNSEYNAYPGQYYKIGTSSTRNTARTTLSLNPFTNDPALVKSYQEWIDSGFQGGDFVSPIKFETWEKWLALDYDSGKFNLNGLLGDTNSHWVNINSYADKRWSEWLSTKATVDYFSRGYSRQSASGNQSYSPNSKLAAMGVGGTYVPYNNAPGRYANGTIGTQRPQYNMNPQENFAFQIDNVISFKTGPVSHKLLVTIDYNQLDETRYNVRYRLGAKPTKSTPYPVYSNGHYWDDYPIGFIPRNYPVTPADLWYPTYHEYADMYDLALPMENLDMLTRDLGFFISERATFFKDHVNIYIGIRYDNIKYTVDDRNIMVPAKGNNPERRDTARFEWSNTAWTPQCGISAGISRNFVVFANYSTAYQPIAQYKTTRDANGDYKNLIFPNEESNGYEFGVRYTAFNERLNATISYFYIDRKNVVYGYTDAETGVTNYDASGEQDSRGIDFDFRWALTSSFQIGGTWGRNDAKYVSSGLPFLLGAPTPGAVRNNYGLNAVYSIKTGPVKGVSVGAGIRYYEKSVCNPGSGQGYFHNTGYPTDSGYDKINFYNVRMSNGQLPFPNLPENAPISTTANPATYSVVVSDGREQILNRPYAVCDFWIKYNFRKPVLGSRTEHTIQFNIKNALDRFYTFDSGMVGDSRQIIFSYAVTF